MTEYEVEPQRAETGDIDWHVTSIDDSGAVHLTIFVGPPAEERAHWYAGYMTQNNARPVIYPSD